MTELNHTPGPWQYEPEDSGDDSVGMPGTPPYVYADPDGDANVYPVCQLEDPRRVRDGERRDEYDDGTEWAGTVKDNGRLIAAAPAMYRALKRIAGQCSEANSQWFVGLAKEVLAKI